MSKKQTALLATVGLLAALAIGLLGGFHHVAHGEPIGPFMLRFAAWTVLSLFAAGSAFHWWESQADSDLLLVARRIREMAERTDARGWVAIRSFDETAELVRSFEGLRQHLIETLASDVRLRSEAEMADRYKTEFLTVISHELRTPLNAILGFTEVLLNEGDGPLTSGQRENLETIRSAGEHLLSLFNDVIDLSAIASGRIQLHREEVVLAPVFDEIVRMLEGQRRSTSVVIRSQVSDPMLAVHADPKRVRQILTNLGTNALKFTEEGSVTFEAIRDGDEVILAVRDTGLGIEARDLPVVFDEYTQTGDFRRRQRGTGLGLGICKRLTDLHGGRIWVESEVSRGSAFYVSLPRGGKGA